MSHSLWNKIEISQSKQLHKNIECDICIVGAGISGLTTAYLLVKGGKKVTVIHAGDLRAGETGRSTAQLNTVHDDGWKEMESMHGIEVMRQCYQSYLEAFNFVSETIRTENMDCGFETLPAYLFAEDGSDAEPWIDEELAAAKRAGVINVSKVQKTPLPGFISGPALLYENQAQFQPLAYLAELRRVLLATGQCEIYGDAGVKELIEETQVILKLDNGFTITANKVVLATNVPIHRKLVPIEALAAYRSYVVGFRVAKGSVPNVQYWDNGDPYHYARMEGASADLDHPEGESDILLVGGEDHRVGVMTDIESHYSELVEWAKLHFPIESVTGLRWSAQTIETFDGMPLIGSCSENGDSVFIITGDSGTGITHGTVGGILLSEKLLGRAVSWEAIYDPHRSRTVSLMRWAKENVTSVTSYQDWLTPGEVGSEEEIPNDEGAIIRHGATKAAVYRNETGELTRLSAVCPHLGAIVRWNGVEKSWDCPAHGSRFTPSGDVLNGPAACGLCALKTEKTVGNSVNEPIVEKRAELEAAGG